MTTLDHTLDGGLPSGGDAAAEPLWRRFLQRFAGAVRAGGEPPEPLPPVRRPPVYRISRVWASHWVVTTPGKTLGYVFESAREAEIFVRQKCEGKPATVEIEIGDLYVAARLEPNRPLLFGSLR
ncbi:MAG TPA: hypothetical protein VMC10_19630 [Stellaceae bacterium]|nr:hypothetical protein [Stellaceae bacterium]